MPKLMTAPTGQGITNTFWMLMNDGQVGAFDLSADDLNNDLAGEFLCEISGYSDDFMTQSAEWGEKPKIKLLFDVVSGEEAGQRFALMFGYSLGAKSYLNHVLSAARKAPILPGEEVNLDDFFGLKLYVYITSEQNAKGYQNVYYKSCREHVERKPKATAPNGNGAASAPAAKAPAPRAARPAAPAPAVTSDDPFDADDEA